MLKVNRLETHDRLLHFNKSDFDIGACVQNIIDQRPFGNNAFYIFAHARTEDDGFNKRIIWQPRLTKPKAQTNSMLFKAYPNSQNIKIIWMIPCREMWPEFKNGMFFGNKIIEESIHNFENNRALLEAKEQDDLDDTKIDAIYRELSQEAKKGSKTKKKLSFKA